MKQGSDEYHNLLREPPMEPAIFFSTLEEMTRGAWTLHAVIAAVELHLFDHVAEPITIADLAAKIGAEERILAPLCQLLAAAGFLCHEGDEYTTTKLSSTFLVSSSPWTQVDFVRKEGVMTRELWSRLSDIVIQGPVKYSSEEFFGDVVLAAMAENALCGRLQETVRAVAAIPGFPDFEKMIDLGGGHGLYAIALSDINEGLEAYVFDRPYVTRLTAGYISRYHADRVHLIPGNFFSDDFGTGYDLVFSSSNPSGKSIEMLPKIARSLKKGGYFVTEQPAEEGRADPLMRLEWHLWEIDSMEKPASEARHEAFPGKEYLSALEENGFLVVGTRLIEDKFRKGYLVAMIIARKQ
jgi:SAM-dependent methyltransferase